VLSPLFGIALAVELSIAVLGTALKGIDTKGAKFSTAFGTPRQIGEAFLTKYLLPFEVASLLLLVAAIGAVVLARRRRGLADEELDQQLRVARRPAFTGTMAESGGLPVGPLPEGREVTIEIPAGVGTRVGGTESAGSGGQPTATDPEREGDR
jgi:hypothetical protein